MVGPALRRLFEDLAKADDRSPYEEALLEEIRPMVSLVDRRPSVGSALAAAMTVARARGGDVLLSRPLVATILGTFLEAPRRRDRPSRAAAVAASGDDLVRLRCPKPDCPNKRL